MTTWTLQLDPDGTPPTWAEFVVHSRCGGAAQEITVRLEASDDLETWRTVGEPMNFRPAGDYTFKLPVTWPQRHVRLLLNSTGA
jgi:hypothetical protein